MDQVQGVQQVLQGAAIRPAWCAKRHCHSKKAVCRRVVLQALSRAEAALRSVLHAFYHGLASLTLQQASPREHANMKAEHDTAGHN